MRRCRGFIRPFWSRRRCHNLFITWYYLELRLKQERVHGRLISRATQTPNTSARRCATKSRLHTYVPTFHTQSPHGGMSLVLSFISLFLRACPFLSAHKDLFYSFERFRFTFGIYVVFALHHFHAGTTAAIHHPTNLQPSILLIKWPHINNFCRKIRWRKLQRCARSCNSQHRPQTRPTNE